MPSLYGNRLAYATDVRIRRHLKIKSDANPFDPAWRSYFDERVRGNPSGKYPKAEPSHWARNGKAFRWDSPPEGGAPGEEVLCRCYGEAILDPDEEQDWGSE